MYLSIDLESWTVFLQWFWFISSEMASQAKKPSPDLPDYESNDSVDQVVASQNAATTNERAAIAQGWFPPPKPKKWDELDDPNDIPTAEINLFYVSRDAGGYIWQAPAGWADPKEYPSLGAQPLAGAQ